MDDSNLLHTHLWGGVPRQFKQGGKTILLRQCARCGRDFAQGLHGEDWLPGYLVALKVEPLGKAASERWLNEKCPRMRVPNDDVDRGAPLSRSCPSRSRFIPPGSAELRKVLRFGNFYRELRDRIAEHVRSSTRVHPDGRKARGQPS
jgi:hypothetical protein